MFFALVTVVRLTISVPRTAEVDWQLFHAAVHNTELADSHTFAVYVVLALNTTARYVVTQCALALVVLLAQSSVFLCSLTTTVFGTERFVAMTIAPLVALDTLFLAAHAGSAVSVLFADFAEVSSLSTDAPVAAIVLATIRVETTPHAEACLAAEPAAALVVLVALFVDVTPLLA